MPTVRIFLPTYRRPHLLPRALASLRAQTFTDWVCEVHNDAPDDPAPERLVRAARDSRFVYQRHRDNLGGTATFNLFFRTTVEPFYAMLEDDNTWSPSFLEDMLEVARLHPGATVFWCNQRISLEQENGTVSETTELVDATATGAAPRVVAWGHPRQVRGALHAHSATLFRSRRGDAFTTPAVPIASVEAFRERMFPHPMVYVPRPLAFFTRTRQTARSDDRFEWAAVQTMLAASFMKHAQLSPTQLLEIWRGARHSAPPSTTTLLFASLVEPSCRALRRLATGADWFRFCRSFARSPSAACRVLRSRSTHADWWRFLDDATANRFAERRAQETA